MLLERTITQLDVGHMPQPQAKKLGHLGFLQWLGALNGDACYMREAMQAHEAARPSAENSPAVAVFCDILLSSLQTPPQPLDLILPTPTRRGGARARRKTSNL